ncbi:hypothetical protein QSV34_09690 [Porticoccus sp. W117]|uniref:hypothetical protein n=1 Tax=Porticoccus sp. W117 TaxID=3054777 RepID=UPI0025922ACC|nr:hypothetical protein [Porticoccus sp. W117]MDM3871627.1 hypothetical protein [Porticoccus sp. W117]
MAYAKIAFCHDGGLFAVIHSLLVSEGVDSLDMMAGGHVTVAGADQGYYVAVAREQQNVACELLRDRGFELSSICCNPNMQFRMA